MRKQDLTHERLRELIDYDPETGVFSRKVRKGYSQDEAVTHERLKEVLDYDPSTGVFLWKAKTGRKTVVGSVAGFEKAVTTGVYRYVSLDGMRYLAHRLAWFWVHGHWPEFVRFKDGNSLNCAIDNLHDAGRVIGTSKANDYLYVRVDSKDYVAARLAWFWVNGEWPGSLIRFRDGNPENLKLSNLRNVETEPAWSRTDQGRHEKDKDRYHAQRDRARDLAFRAKFGISLEEYNTMLSAQNGVCAICHKAESIKRNGTPRWLAVDHCHGSGKVRGLLCGTCNPMIGYAKDDIEVLEKAIAYLRAHGIEGGGLH